MRKEGVRKVAYVGYWSPTLAIDVLLYFNFVFVFLVRYFHFRQVKENLKTMSSWIGNMQRIECRLSIFELILLDAVIHKSKHCFYYYWCNTWLKNAVSILCRLYSADFFPVCCALSNNETRFGPLKGNAHYKRENNRLRFAYSWCHRY